MKHSVNFFKFILLGTFLIDHVTGLFEDQAGSYDWRQQYVGRPLYSQIDTATNRLYVTTDQNLLGAINIKNGNIVWRKIFESNENGKVDYTLWGSKEILVITGNGQRVQSFNYNSGFANWEYILFSNNSQLNTGRITGIESSVDNELFYFTNGYQICSTSIRDKACADLPVEDGFVYSHLFEIEQSVFIVGFKEGLVQKIQYNSLLSAVLSKSVTNQPLIKSEGNNCIKSSSYNTLSCYSSDHKKIVSIQINTGTQIQSNEFNVEIDNSEGKLVWNSGERYIFEEKLNEKVNLFLMKQNAENIVLLRSIQSAESYEVILKSKNDQDFHLIFSKYKENKDLSFNAVSIKNDQKPDLVINAVSVLKDQKPIIEFKTQISEAKNGQISLLSFCFFNDYSMSVFSQQGARLFTREEGLAYISNVEMVDFPLLHLQEELQNEFGTNQKANIIEMFIRRIRSQIFQLKEFLLVDMVQKLTNYLNSFKRPVAPSSASSTSASTTSSSTSNLAADEITRDEFNLNKLIVVSTSVGKVFGLYTSSNGRVLWSFFLKNSQPFELNHSKKKLSMPLFLQRTAAHLPREPQCVVISKMKTDQGFKSLAFFFNPITGKSSKGYPKEGIVFDYDVKQAFISNTLDENFLKPLVLLDHENKLHVLPETSAAFLTTKSNKPNVLYMATVQNEQNSMLVGYSMKFINKPLPELWRINIEDETITAIAALQPHDRVHSHGKVLGDRSVLYKYLNPNLIGVVTTGMDGQKIPFVNVYLIDTVTGSIVNSFNHKRCKGPVQIVHSENWFFYSLYNLKYRRFEVTSVELFEGSNQFNTTHFSSLDDIKPIVYTKSYIVQKAFDSMQVTLTEKGISTKDIIVACQTGVIMEIPWILIDPRRPVKMTEVEREENLLPYMPEIPLNYEFSLNYYNYVFNVRGITTAPSGLESTSLVFAYGLDIFFTRVFPSKTFDLLREDFDYFFVSTLMVGLILGTFLSKKLASSSQLKKAWK